MLGLPDDITACLFDLDGVLTSTVGVHQVAWEETFNAYLRTHAERTSAPYVPFDPAHDYHHYVDGRARADGVRSFLASRGITLPEGNPAEHGAPDNAGLDTVHDLGSSKNARFHALLQEQGVKPYEGSLAYLQAAKAAGLRRAVVSASANCREIVQAAGIADLLEVRVDGRTAREIGLHGKPHPDLFLTAAQRLGVPPRSAAVFEDALAGVQAGKAGGFGLIIGVDRAPPEAGHAAALRREGADIVVRDLAELLSAGAPHDP